jgi:hypothetical protein
MFSYSFSLTGKISREFSSLSRLRCYVAQRTRLQNVRIVSASKYLAFRVDVFVKSRKSTTNVIPAKAGIQKYQMVTKALDPGFRRGDDFLRIHQH